jgi:hypothetical protein
MARKMIFAAPKSRGLQEAGPGFAGHRPQGNALSGTMSAIARLEQESCIMITYEG